LVHALLLPKTFSLFEEELEEKALQNLLECLSQKKISWEEFESKVEDPSSFSRIATSQNSRTLLHLAVLDDQISWVKKLESDLHLKTKRDLLGLSALDMAYLLNRKEALKILEPLQLPNIAGMPNIEGFEYLQAPIFESEKRLDEVLGIVSKAKNEDLIPSEKIWMGIYFDKEIRKGIHAPIEIRYMNAEIGYGIFASKKIPACTYVGEYTGVIQQKSSKELKDKTYTMRYTVWEGKKNFCIDAEKMGNFTRFLNHSSRPNLGLQSVYWRGVPRMIFISLVDIPEGAHMTFDYGTTFWKHHKRSPIVL
jgi:hypothetical protein